MKSLLHQKQIAVDGKREEAKYSHDVKLETSDIELIISIIDSRKHELRSQINKEPDELRRKDIAHLVANLDKLESKIL